MTFLARTGTDLSPVPWTSGSGVRATLQRAVAAALRPSQLALGRSGAGVVMIAQPRAVGRLLGVHPAGGSTSAVVQMLGARELALGLGCVLALRRGGAGAARLWLAASLLSDVLDALVVAGAVGRGRMPGGPGAALVAVATTAAGAQAAALARA